MLLRFLALRKNLEKCTFVTAFEKLPIKPSVVPKDCIVGENAPNPELDWGNEERPRRRAQFKHKDQTRLVGLLRRAGKHLRREC